MKSRAFVLRALVLVTAVLILPFQVAAQDEPNALTDVDVTSPIANTDPTFHAEITAVNAIFIDFWWSHTAIYTNDGGGDVYYGCFDNDDQLLAFGEPAIILGIDVPVVSPLDSAGTYTLTFIQDVEPTCTLSQAYHDAGDCVIGGCPTDDLEVTGGSSARFSVTKVYTDGNDQDSVEITVECDDTNATITPPADTTLENGQTETWLIEDFVDGTECTATEGAHFGYIGSGDPEGTCDSGTFNNTDTPSCTITNQTYATFDISKVFTDGSGDSVDYTFDCSDDAYDENGSVAGGASPGTTIELIGFTAGMTCSVTESGLASNYYAVSRSGCGAPTDAPVDIQPGDEESCLFTNAPTRTTFAVDKIFSDNAETPVEVSIDCNTGLIPDHTKIVHPDDDPWEVKWIITDFDSGDLNCTVSESPLAGYLPDYSAGINAADLLAFGTPSDDASGCHFTGMVGGEDANCTIFNELQQVEVEVTKQWFDEHPEFNNSLWARVKWYCSPVRYESSHYGGGVYWHQNLTSWDGKLWYSDSDFTPANNYTYAKSFSVWPNWDPTNPTVCNAEERIRDSSVESDHSDCDKIELYPGIEDTDAEGVTVGARCTIYNTRIYEGIPTLSQYGLAILALLMLGVGMAGFRRFA